MNEWVTVHFDHGRHLFGRGGNLDDDIAQSALTIHRGSDGWWNVIVDTERFCVLVNRKEPTRMEIWVRKDLLK